MDLFSSRERVLKEGSKLLWPDNGEKPLSNSRIDADGISNRRYIL